MAPHRDKKSTARRSRFRVECLEDRVLLAEAATWVGQNNTDLVGRDGVGPDGYQDIAIHLLGLDPSRAIDRVDVQRQYAGAWTATASLASQSILVRDQNQATGSWSSEANLYLEAWFSEAANSRYEFIRIRYADGSSVTINNLLSTTSVNDQLRVQGKELGVTWVGQDGPDLTGPGPSPGADGVKDIHLKLSNLFDSRRAIDGWRSTYNVDSDTIVVTMPAADGSTITWLAGPRPTGLSSSYNRAEIFLDPADPSRADLYLNPVAGLTLGATVTVTASYNRINKSDASPDFNGSTGQLVATIATTPDPSLAANPPQGPSIPISFSGPSALWSSQDGPDSATPGLVHVTLSGLPAGWSVAEAVLSDNIGWVWTPGNLNSARRLTIRPLADPTKADLSFAPIRDESDALMSLRFRLAGGTVQYVSQFRGGAADPTLRDPSASTNSITVDPTYVSQAGLDLNSLAKQYGTIRLKAGVYPLSAPLDLANSISLIAEPGAIFSFSQASTAPAWSYAIMVRKSHTTLDGLTIRFATPIRWTNDFQLDPAVIGSTYGPSNFGPNPKVDLNFRNLDIEYTPQASGLDAYRLTNTRLIRSNYDDSGVIANNILRGGQVEVWGGPWKITGNDYRGAMAGTSVSPVFAIRSGHDILLEGNHAHQLDPTGITYSFLLFTGNSSNTIVRNNLVDGGIGRDASVAPGGLYNFPELILTESYDPHYEGPAFVSAVSRRVLQVGALRGTPGEAGDIVAVLSGPSAGRWFRITQRIDPQTYLLDADLPTGDFTISITRGFVNDLYEGNTLDTSSLKRSSSNAFQLAGTHVGTTVRNNLVIGARPFSIAASATQGAWQGSTAFPAPWGWSHSVIFDLKVDANTFRDPVFWIPDATPAGATRIVAEAVIAVEHSRNIRENRGRLYLTGSVTDNQFVYSDVLVAGTSGHFTSLRIGDAGTIDPSELRLTRLSGNTATTSDAFVQAGRKVMVRFESGDLAGQDLEPLPRPSGSSTLTAVTRNQDGSDRVGRSTNTAPDGLQDVHIVLSGLRTDLAIRTVDVYPYGSGHYQYAAAGLPANTPGLAPGSWRVGVVRGLVGASRFAGTADLYIQPYQPIQGTGHFDILVTYADGSTAYVALYGVEVTDPSLRVGSGPATVTATSLGQDNSDVVGAGPTLAPDGYQDIHIVLAGLPSNKAIAQVDVLPYGYGQFQYVAPLPGALPTQYRRDPRIWRAGLVRTSLGPGVYATTADLYVPSYIPENGVRAGTNLANHYNILITFADGSSVNAVAWGVVSDPNAKVVGLAARSYGQDGADFVGPTPAIQSDGVQDLHIGLSGLRTDREVSQVEIWAVGGGQWSYQGTATQPGAKLIRASTGPGSFAATADLYLAPNSSFLGADGTLKPQRLQVLVRYGDGTTSEPVFLDGVLADPRLLNPVATSRNQDSHDLAQLAASPGSNGKQDVHFVLSNLPTTTPVARVVVNRLGGGGSYQSDGSLGSWMAVLVQPRTGTATYATTADLYFEPDPKYVDLNQSYRIDIYLADTSSRPFSIVTTVTATPGLAMPSAATNATLQAKTVSAAATVTPSAAIAPPTAPIRESAPTPQAVVSMAPSSTTVSYTRKVPFGPLGPPQHHPKQRRGPTLAHRAAAKLAMGTGHRAQAALKASVRRQHRGR